VLGGYPLWLVRTAVSGSSSKYLNQKLFKISKPQNNQNQGTVGVRESTDEPNLSSRLGGNRSLTFGIFIKKSIMRPVGSVRLEV
jgi:hypothetical protein